MVQIPVRSGLLGNLNGFNSKLRYAFQVPHSFRNHSSFSIQNASLRLPSFIFSSEDSVFFQNEGLRNPLRVTVTGFIQTYENNADLINSLNQFLVDGSPLTLPQFENFIQQFSSTKSSFCDTLTPNANLVDSNLIIDTNFVNLPLALDSTVPMESNLGDSTLWIFLELDYLSEANFLSRTAIPALTLINQNETILDTITIVPALQPIGNSGFFIFIRSKLGFS